jgi:uncharacterized protein (DUF433 family)
MNEPAILNREMYSEAEAARLLSVRQSTLHYWLEGGERRGKVYKPVIRAESTGGRTVTWAEFIEAGLLREFRRTHRVPMIQLRRFIELLRGEFGVPYPLAHETPLVSGRELVLKAQDEAELDSDYWLVAFASGQLLLTPASDEFVHRVTWADGIAVGWRPHADPSSPVRIDPDVRFGRPAVGGVSTEALWEQSESGWSVDELAQTFDLKPQQVRWALAYENSMRAA